MTQSPLVVCLAAAMMTLAPAAIAAGTPPASRARAAPTQLLFAPGRVLVALDGLRTLGVDSQGALRSDDRRIDGVLAAQGLETGRALGPTARVDPPASPRFYALESTRSDFDPLAAAAVLRATGAFRAVAPDYRIALFTTLPNDPYLPDQWYVNDGAFADIRLPAAWDIERGDTSVVIAIMDTGIDTGHPDLATKIWHNPGEIAGNAIDDDGNGLVDDAEGWDFGTDDADPRPEYTADASGIDVGFHGTFCAGIAAAATDNAIGIGGAGWHCRLMPLKVSHPDSGLFSSAIASAFVYAVEEGASIISMSFGGPGDPGVPEFFQALVDMATAAGVVCVAAAGNDGVDIPVYPAACDDVLAVAATTDANTRADFSNFGPWVDVAAPGSLMWSTICDNYTFTELDQIIYIYFFLWDGESPYMYGDGTSFACPLTAGVCGLVRARFPSLTPRQVAQHIVTTGDVVAYDQPIGPRVNAFAAVATAPVAVEFGRPLPGLGLEVDGPNPFSVACEIRFSLPAEGAARLAIYDVAGRRVRELAGGTLAAGPHRARWDGRDAQGRRLGGGVYVIRLESPAGASERKLVLLGR